MSKNLFYRVKIVLIVLILLLIMEMILSFDVGVKNLAFCSLAHNTVSETLRIIEWDTVDIYSCKSIDMKRKLLQFLNLQTCWLSYHTILIENQPSIKNPLMKTIANLLFDYFLIKGMNMDIRFISPSNKIKSVKYIYDVSYLKHTIKQLSSVSSTYLKTKKLSILITSFLLKNYLFDRNSYKKLKLEKKKDDLCDTFLQAFYFIYHMR